MFKVGDLVIVRHHTQEEKDQYPNGWSTAMNNVEGKIGRVCEVWSRCCMVDYDGSSRLIVCVYNTNNFKGR